MITRNVIQRIFHIKRDNSTGTAFTIDRGSKQYLATARHVVEGIGADRAEYGCQIRKEQR